MSYILSTQKYTVVITDYSSLYVLIFVQFDLRKCVLQTIFNWVV